MAAKTAVEVAEMESELYLLRREKAQLETHVALLTQERDACKVELALASSRAREEMIKSAQLESIISQTSMGLVSALRSYHQQRQAEAGARRAAQERELGVGSEDTPTFLQRRQEEREAADDAERITASNHRQAELEAGSYRGDRPALRSPSSAELRDAAEVVGRPMPKVPLPRHLQPAKDHPLLPQVEMTAADRMEGDLGEMMHRAVGR